MEKNKVIRILREFKSFSIFSGDNSKKELTSVLGENKFQFGEKQKICLETESICFELNLNTNNTIILSLSKANFESKGAEEQLLNRIGEDLGLFKKYGENKSYYSFFCNESDRFGTAKIAFRKKENDEIFILVYSTARSRESKSQSEDLYSDDIVFVKSLLNVTLSPELTSLIF